MKFQNRKRFEYPVIYGFIFKNRVLVVVFAISIFFTFLGFYFFDSNIDSELKKNCNEFETRAIYAVVDSTYRSNDRDSFIAILRSIEEKQEYQLTNWYVPYPENIVSKEDTIIKRSGEFKLILKKIDGSILSLYDTLNCDKIVGRHSL